MTFLTFEETEQSKIFDNAEFGYWKVTVERPLRARGHRPGSRLCAEGDQGAQGGAAGSREDGAPVIRRIHKGQGRGRSAARACSRRLIGGKPCVVEYEPDSDLRDTETVPLTEPGGIEAFIRREVLPHAPDAWIDEAKTAIGYEISFTRYFYKPQPLRSLEEIRADILAVEKETEGLMAAILGTSDPLHM